MAVLDAPSWADSRRAGALDGLSGLRDEEAVPAVIERTRYGIPSRGRRAAVLALASLSDSRRAREHLESLLDDQDPHFRSSVVDALGALGDPKARGALRGALDRELDGRVARRIREVLRDIFDSGSAERKRLGDEVETLRGELAELRGRVAGMEAKRPLDRAKAHKTKKTRRHKAAGRSR
jgi:aminopeptidase N